jgi:hypothetical protein
MSNVSREYSFAAIYVVTSQIDSDVAYLDRPASATIANLLTDAIFEVTVTSDLLKLLLALLFSARPTRPSYTVLRGSSGQRNQS